MTLDCSEVIPGLLWVGTFVRPEELDTLVQKGITTVVSLQSDDDMVYCGLSERKLVKSLAAAGIAFQRMPVEDFRPDELARRLPECVSALRTALSHEGARIYLHCTAGINRAPTVAAGYLILERGLAARIAYDHLRMHRACSPYLRVLEEFEEHVRRGRIDSGQEGS